MTEDLFPAPRPSADRPLAGLTVLVVEDSRFASEAMRLLCLRSGARIRRADSLRAARRHLSAYRPGAVLVDLGLPDGSGCDLIAALAAARPRVEVVLAISGDPGGGPAALAAGADGFLQKPVLSLGDFQHALLSRLPQDRRQWQCAPDGQAVDPDRAALMDDLSLVSRLLAAPGDGLRLGYAGQFLEGLAVQAGDAALGRAAGDLRRATAGGRPCGPDLARLAGLVRQRLEARPAV